MELKLKDSNDSSEEKKFKVDHNEEDREALGAGDDKFRSEMYVNNPVRITSTVVAPTPSAPKSGFDAMVLVKWVVIIIVAVVAFNLIKGLVNPKAVDVTGYGNYDTAQLEKAIDETLEKNTAMSNKITHYSNGTVTVDSAEGIGVVYIDGEQKGLHIDEKKYCMYGISIGDGERVAEENMTYDYTDSMLVINDIAVGNSTAVFYYNTTKNDCLVVFVNDNSARIVAMTYFNDYKLISTNLSSIE